MSNYLGQLYATTKNAEKYIVLNSNNVELSGNVEITNGAINFTGHDDLFIPADSGIVQKVQDLSNNLLISKIDASFNNVDISGDLNVEGNIIGNATSATTLQNSRTIAGTHFDGSVDISINYNNLSNLPNSKVFMRIDTDSQTGNITEQTITSWRARTIYYPSDMYVSSNDIFKPPRDGYYFITFNTTLTSTTTNSVYARIRLKQNGIIVGEAGEREANDGNMNPKWRFLNISIILYLTTTDKLEFTIQADNNYSLPAYPYTTFNVHNVD